MEVRTYEHLSKEKASIRAFGIYISGMVVRTVVGALGTGGGALVAGVTRDTHDCEFYRQKNRGLVVSLLKNFSEEKSM